MSAEEELHKLKVPELKELLAKHHLVQTGKKEDLIRRLVENRISATGEVQSDELEAEHDDELIEAPELDEAPVSDAAPASAVAASQPPPAEPQASAHADADASTPELTPEQQALKKRAERFGLPFNPAAPRTAPKPESTSNGSKSKTSASSSTAAAPAAPASAPAKAGAIDKTPLGVSAEVLAARAAKFGLPEKKEPVKSGNGEARAPEAGAGGGKGLQAPSSASASAPKAEVEVTPEMRAKLAEEEEKRRKRAEKFGTGVKHPAVDSGASGEPDAKKAKV